MVHEEVIMDENSLSANQLAEQILQLQQQIDEHSASSSRIQNRMRSLENKAYNLVSDEKDEDGKPVHSNESKRKAAADLFLDADQEYQGFLADFVELENLRRLLDHKREYLERLWKVSYQELRIKARDRTVHVRMRGDGE